jgi:BlaI family penicillinase repressor
MARPTTEQPTNGELNILRVLWELGPSRLSTICEALSRQRKVALTTVATMLKIMKAKRQVKRTITTRGAIWQATLSQEEAGNHCLQNLMNKLFEGSAQKLVVHLLARGNLSAKDQKEIRKLLGARRETTHQ